VNEIKENLAQFYIRVLMRKDNFSEIEIAETLNLKPNFLGKK
jgi:hypothetical protein